MYFWFSFRRLGKFLDNMRTYTITKPVRDSQKISVVTRAGSQRDSTRLTTIKTSTAIDRNRLRGSLPYRPVINWFSLFLMKQYSKL